MKIAITGKGGVGKTTLAGLLARSLAEDSLRVLAVDADPDANLAAAVGIAAGSPQPLPFSKLTELARSRTGADQNSGGLFKLNPRVDDLPQQFWLEHQGVRVLKMGTVDHAGSGCVCPEHTLVRSLMRHLLLDRDEMVIMDMEAGIEHLGRGTADAVDLLVVVVEPGSRSVQTALQVEQLAQQLAIARVGFVASKVDGPDDLEFIRQALGPKRTLLGQLSWSDTLRRADKSGQSPFDFSGPFIEEVDAIKRALLALVPRMEEAAHV
ncbi:AAA family ATPase [Ferrimonas kyonanensis]|uniref:ATP-binding protein n=1 Tax=Ferrimonas kyonanensis TaxID=364763 RepID=UPI00042088D3|nr:AAA family ATPase [Ferrimonas kyonanensis]